MSRFSNIGPRQAGRSVIAAVGILSFSLIAFLVPAGSASAQPFSGASLNEYTRFPGGNWGSYNYSGSWGLPNGLVNGVPFADPP